MVSGKSWSEDGNNYIGCEDYLKQFQVWGLIKPGNFRCKKVVSPTLLLRYRINWEDPEYASRDQKAQPEEKLPQGVIIFYMIARKTQNFVSFGNSVSSKGGGRSPHLLYPC